MVLGARQAGKSYLIQNLFAEEYSRKNISMLIAGRIMNLSIIAILM